MQTTNDQPGSLRAEAKRKSRQLFAVIEALLTGKEETPKLQAVTIVLDRVLPKEIRRRDTNRDDICLRLPGLAEIKIALAVVEASKIEASKVEAPSRPATEEKPAAITFDSPEAEFEWRAGAGLGQDSRCAAETV